MELAIYITNVTDISYINDLFEDIDINPELNLKLNIAKNDLKEYIESIPFKRVYFGNEFCQHLLPDINAIKNIFDICIKQKLNISFVTPLVTDYGIKKLNSIFEFISEHYKNTEIIFNDWGVYKLLREKYDHFEKVAGRLIDKTLRDPRLNDYDYNNLFSEDGLRFLRKPNLTSESYKVHLLKLNIKRVEFDLLPQGFDFIDDEVYPFSLSIYIPFGHVTTGRQCMMRMLTQKQNEKFYLNDKCGKECRNYIQTMFKRQGSFLGDIEGVYTHNVELFRKGNSVFYLNTDITKINNIKSFNRIVYQPLLPV